MSFDGSEVDDGQDDDVDNGDEGACDADHMAGISFLMFTYSDSRTEAVIMVNLTETSYVLLNFKGPTADGVSMTSVLCGFRRV